MTITYTHPHAKWDECNHKTQVCVACISRHDYEPGDAHHPMHTDPLCRVCGQPARNHRRY